MSKLDIHGCVEAVVDHFYRADYLHLLYTLPVEAYSLHRQLQLRICEAWNRFEHARSQLSTRECILLAEAWLIASPEHTKPMFVNIAWQPPCAKCGEIKIWHQAHPENNPAGDPPDRWLCGANNELYEPIEYKLPMSGKHPTEIDVHRSIPEFAHAKPQLQYIGALIVNGSKPPEVTE